MSSSLRHALPVALALAASCGCTIGSRSIEQNRLNADENRQRTSDVRQTTPSCREIVPVVFSSADDNLAHDGKERREQLPAPKSAGLTLDGAINTCLIADPKIRAGLEAINPANADALTAALKPNPVLWSDIQLLPLTRPFTPTVQGGPPQFRCSTRLSDRLVSIW